jgi:hypothetical protein
MEHDQINNEEIIYQLFDPSSYAQEGSTGTASRNTKNEESSLDPKTSLTRDADNHKNKNIRPVFKRKLDDTFIDQNDDNASSDLPRDNDETAMEYLDVDTDNNNEEEDDEAEGERMELIEQTIKRKNLDKNNDIPNKKVRFNDSSKRYNDSTEYVNAKKRKVSNINPENISNGKRKIAFDQYDDIEWSNKQKKKNLNKDNHHNLKRSYIAHEDIAEVTNNKRLKNEYNERGSQSIFDDDEIIPIRRTRLDEIMRNNKRMAPSSSKPFKKIKIEPIEIDDSDIKWTRYSMSNIQ